MVKYIHVKSDLAESEEEFARLRKNVLFRIGGILSLFSLAMMIALYMLSTIPALFFVAVWSMPIFGGLFLTGLLFIVIGVLIYIYQRFSGDDGLFALKTGPLR